MAIDEWLLVMAGIVIGCLACVVWFGLRRSTRVQVEPPVEQDDLEDLVTTVRVGRMIQGDRSSSFLAKPGGLA